MKSQTATQDSTALLRARNPLLWVVTREEARVEKYLFEAAAAAGYGTRFWDIAAGVTGIDGRPDTDLPDTAGDPDTVLTLIGQQEGTVDNPNRGVWVLRDLPTWLKEPVGSITLRRLRNLARSLPGQPRHQAQAIIIISPSANVPDELANHTTVIEWPLPDREEIAALLDATVASLPDELQAKAVNGSRDAAIDAAIGLSGEEAQATFARSLVQSRTIDPAVIAAEKKRVIAKTGGIEWFDPPAEGMEAVGGYDNYKSWLISRASAYSPAARAYGLPLPKGTLVVGVSGCGKSLSAKAVGAEWKVPVLRVDLSALKGKYVGESEANLRSAFAVIEAIGRCVVWIDEIEKALAGATDGSADGGVSSDALGFLLSWMQERQGEAFVIATANNAEKLPPELLRKGRFDEVWWVDLPNKAERASIVLAALKAHGRDNTKSGRINPAAVAAATDLFNGAEIAALVPDAMFTAFNDKAREITTDDLLHSAKQVVPLAKTASEKISKLREYWLGRARPATSVTVDTAVKGSDTRMIDIN